MKELTLEEKAKRYDEALDKARDLYLPSDSALLEEIFPELIESNDEKIREEIINYFECQSRDESTRKDIHNKWIAWLKKQGQTFTKEDVDDAYLKGITDTKSEIQKQYEASYQIRKDIATFIFNYRGDIKDRAKWMNYLGIKVSFVENKSKSALEATKEEKVDDSNKVESKFEPRFKVGKWIVWQGKCYKVYDNSCGYELLDQDGFITSLEYGTVDENAHLWDITKDAKDGDVLCSESGWICVFKALDILTNTFSSYCFIDKDKWFCNTGSECHTLDKAFIKAYNGEIYPATKEQRDTIMKQWMPQDVLLMLKSKYKM